jgi:hypothetical protein
LLSHTPWPQVKNDSCGFNDLACSLSLQKKVSLTRQIFWTPQAIVAYKSFLAAWLDFPAAIKDGIEFSTVVDPISKDNYAMVGRCHNGPTFINVMLNSRGHILWRRG